MAAMEQRSPLTDLNAFLAGIGHICLQWALLEQTILAVIAAAENLPFEKVYTRYGSLDMRQRLNMAIKLAHEDKWPVRLTKPLQAIRKEIQNDGERLAEKRNMFVHGAHEATDTAGEFALTMSRWAPDKRRQIVTLVDAAQLTARIAELVQQADAVFRNYGAWKFGTPSEATTNALVANRAEISKLPRRQNFKRGLKLILESIYPSR
jgi:hypothetical protein